jgi:hypothetical protein
MKVSLLFYPNNSKKSKRNGKTPLYARVCFRGSKAEERLNIEVGNDTLLKWDPMTMRFSDRTLTANKHLNSLDQRFEEFIYFNSTTLYSYNPRKILDHVLSKPEKKEENVIEFIDNYFSKCVEKNSELAAGTIRNYRKSINHLKRFLTIVNKNNLCFNSLSRLFVTEFLQYLKSSDTLNNKEAMTMVSACSILKSFRPIINAAVDRGLIEKNPFREIKLKTRSPKRDRLNITQVKQLKRLDLSKFPTQRIYRDIFL